MLDLVAAYFTPMFKHTLKVLNNNKSHATIIKTIITNGKYVRLVVTISVNTTMNNGLILSDLSRMVTLFDCNTLSRVVTCTAIL